ncbi:type II CAAX endopeptidase family protein [Streptomyces sp. 549]|uniref:CPBP family intramembrane glutamic endopeptidase n=1 Tax=Streptomyces sp. 549 TaxID=3049076 RepID=UPI0024C21C3A|nr:type II CAAX endopeptidase family protein [Streptomyces sp. 549]MDK1475818.1 type II CAAX endopeptidase family protein [Streptomyces sp. 549]
MTTPAPDGSLAYHRLARLPGRYPWWKPLLGGVVLVGVWLVLFVVLDIAAYVTGTVAGRPEVSDGVMDFGAVGDTALDLMALAVAIPAALLVVRWVERRPAGTLSSVTGRLRWRWLLACLLIAAPVVTVMTGLALLLPEEPGAEPVEWAGLGVLLPALLMLVLLVPFQAAAEEYVFRGWLLQAVGGLFRSPWIAVVPQAVLFAAAHGWGTVWGFADLVFFGLVVGWLTIRTGGLEAAIGLHVVNNLVAFGLSAAVVDGLRSEETAADAPWQLVALDVVSISLYALAVTWWARRRKPATEAVATDLVPPPALVPVGYPPYPPYPPGMYPPYPHLPHAQGTYPPNPNPNPNPYPPGTPPPGTCPPPPRPPHGASPPDPGA